MVFTLKFAIKIYELLKHDFFAVIQAPFVILEQIPVVMDRYTCALQSSARCEISYVTQEWQVNKFERSRTEQNVNHGADHLCTYIEDRNSMY